MHTLGYFCQIPDEIQYIEKQSRIELKNKTRKTSCCGHESIRSILKYIFF